jgi:hypothetical protein
MSDQRGKYMRNVGDVLAAYNAIDTASPDTFMARTVGKLHATDATIALATTGKMTLCKVTLGAGDLVTRLGFVSGGTAGATMTAWWLALYSPTGVLMAQTADQVAGAIAANTEFEKALATAQRIKESGIYRIGLCIAASTVPTVVGLTVPPANATSAEGVLSEETTATYTTTAPGTLPALTARRGTPYFFAN